jgi:mono/diheme cytochrome c family protein
MSRLIGCAVALALGLTACGPATRSERVLGGSGTAAGGKATYDAYCASCHGSDGRGTPHGGGLVTPTAWDGAVAWVDTVIDGIPGTNMGSYAALSNQQLGDVYAYIKSLPK